MKITVAGYGFVGRAVVESFKDHNYEIYDPQFPEWNWGISQDTEAVIVCVSTPQHKGGACNINNVHDVIDRSPDVPILIKSTISLEGWEHLKTAFPDRKISFSPEFLRAKSAIDDFLNQKYMILGDDTPDSFWSNLFTKRFKRIRIHHCTAEEAITVKYAENSFLALKVSFFNQIYDFCEATNVDFNEVRYLLTLDPRINDDHSFVTAQRGWGGHCFPKDTSAFLHTADQFGTSLSLIEESIKYNDIIRRKDLTKDQE
jgi:UDPglucose 6-dehydrogenase